MRKLLIVAMAFLAVACGGSNKKVDMGEAEMKMPQWFLSPPTSEDALYGVARQESKDIQIAINKAKHEATVDVSKKLDVKVKAMSKKFAEEVGASAEDATLRQSFEEVSKLVVSETVSGIQVKEQEVLQADRDGVKVNVAYVLMELRFDMANKILMNKIKAKEEMYTKLQASKSFKELEAEVDKLEAK